VIEKKTQKHPTTTNKMVTTWWLPQKQNEQNQPAPQVKRDEVSRMPRAIPILTSRQAAPTDKIFDSASLRRLVTEALTEEQITSMAYDNFRSAYE
jgi:hypothetical protein